MQPLQQLLSTCLAARRAWRWALATLFMAVSYLALTPDPPPYIDTGWDKANHLLAFGALAFAARFALPPARWQGTLIVLALLGYGVLIEVLQSFVPGRQAEFADVLADGVGIGVGVLVAWTTERNSRS